MRLCANIQQFAQSHCGRSDLVLGDNGTELEATLGGGKRMPNREDAKTLTREIYPIPDFVERALRSRRLVRAYRARPPYQQNDYVGWITSAKREETQQKRLAQMLDELEQGGVYMKMRWTGG
jgi:hypothetical protein